MKRFLCILVVVLGCGTLLLADGGPAPPASSGRTLWGFHCQLCHDHGGRATQLAAMSKFKPDFILKEITSGTMKEAAFGMSEADRHALVEFITSSHQPQPSKLSMCGKPQQSTPSGASSWNGWSPDLTNTRFQPKPGLDASQVPALKLRWAFVFPDVPTAANQVSVVNGRLYTGSWDGTVYALNPQTGCAYWTYQAETAVRAAVSLSDGAVLFGDLKANVYALDAETGKLKWKVQVDDNSFARITGSPIAYAGTLYVPVASLEEAAAMNSTYSCCTFRGSVVALNIATGKQLWKTYTIPDPPKKIRQTRFGASILGPSGVGVWSAPTLDAKRKLLYIATGNNYSQPDTPATDAIVALDLATGEKKWLRSLHPKDNSNGSCFTDRSQCPEPEGPDFDFGASPILVHPAGGPDLILAGQKSGILYALDPDREGKVLWQTKLGRGGRLGGIEWGMATDGERAYVAIADWNRVDGLSGPAEGSINAVDVKTGRKLWSTPNPTGICEGRRPMCDSAMLAPVTAVPGAVFAGSIDGQLRAYDAATGQPIWQFDTDAEFDGTNQLKGHGGSISGAGVTVADGLVFQTSGYNVFASGMPGNVLLVFGADKASDKAGQVAGETH